MRGNAGRRRPSTPTRRKTANRTAKETPTVSSDRFCLHCILPPYVIDELAKSSDPKLRKTALDAVAASAEARAVRSVLASLPAMAAIPSPGARKHRLIYDLQGQGFPSL